MSMISQPHYLDDNPSLFEWDLSHINGENFELDLQSVVRRELKFVELCQVLETKKTRDRGKDIVLKFKEDIHILGYSLVVPRGQILGIAHIEIKKSDAATLSANDFSGSFTQLWADDYRPAYFILVTNATLTPATLYQAWQECELRGCKFLLVDRLRLACALSNDNYEWLAIPLPPQRPKLPDVAVSYCIQDAETISPLLEESEIISEGYPSGGRKRLGLFLAIHNYSNEIRTVRLALRSDLNWALEGEKTEVSGSPEALTYYIAPGGYKATKLRLTQHSLEALDELRIGLDVDGRPRTLEIRGPQVEFDFDPPLFGESHIACAQQLTQQLTNSIKNKQPPRLISLHGKAGAGKTKIISEVKKRCAGKGILFGGVELRSGSEGKDFANILKQFSAKSGGVTTNSPATISAAELLNGISSLPRWDHYVIVLEDIHHASETVFNDLRHFCKMDCNVPVTVIVTGRDDGTFTNDDYDSFIYHIKEVNSAHHNSVQILDISLKPWLDAECEQFIRLTIENVPASVAKRIHILSENTPFGVIQAIEYLLDLKIVEVVNRNTVGVLNAESLAAKNSLPQALKELITLRVKRLASDAGKNALVILNVLALLGQGVEKSIFENIFPLQDDKQALHLMQKRRFIQNHSQKLRYTHENLQIYFLTDLETTAAGKKAAKHILASPIACAKLSVQRIAYLNFVARDFKKAFAGLAYLFERVKNNINISSVDIPSTELQNIRPLTQASIFLKKEPRAIANLCKLECYLALHNQPLALAMETCLRQEETLESLVFDAYQKELVLLEVRQLRAHAMLNMGYVQAAQKYMIEIVARATLNPLIEDNCELMFDVYDRLQNIYHQLNHKKMFLYYSQLSGVIAERLNDPKLRALVIASRVKEHYFDDPNEYLRLTQEATAVARQTASPRHICHNELNLCIAELINSGPNKIQLHEITKRLSAILILSEKKNYSFSTTRTQLALAVTYCLHGLGNVDNRQRAQHYAKMGIESCIRFSNGFFSWQLYNLMGIIELAQRDTETSSVAGYFETAISYLSKQGLLFLGNLDSCSPNLAVISNYIKFLDQHIGDCATFDFVSKLNFYDRGIGDTRRQTLELITSVRKFGLIGRTVPLPKPLLDPESGFLLALR